MARRFPKEPKIPDNRDPRVVALDVERAAAQKALAEAKNEVSKVDKRLEEVCYAIILEQGIKAETNGENDEVEEIEPAYLEIPYIHACPGPIGTCAYDSLNDPALDCCIFCHNPYERK